MTLFPKGSSILDKAVDLLKNKVSAPQPTDIAKSTGVEGA